MRLYHHPLSFNARRAVMAAVHLNLPVELVLVDRANGQQKTPELLHMNPNGRVPVLDDEGTYLTESHAIMQYLADKSPRQTVWPEERRARADVNRWMFWSAQHFGPSIAVLNWQNVVKGILGLGGPDPAMVAYGEELVHTAARVLDRHLEGRTWVAEDRLTLADLALAAPLMAIEHAKVPVASYKHLLAWFARVQALEAWKKTAG
jgi:glutathione S-transferase